jgi:hypothetical protein
VRLLNNILQRDGASDIDVPNGFLNYSLEKIFSLEISILRWINLPFGVSILAVVSK